jgi:drug/metabolite transporter (DMT)-like permease
VLFWVAYSLLLKRVPKELPQPALLTSTAMAAVLFMLPFYLWVSPNEGLLSLDRKTIWGILYMALFPSAVAFLLWNRGVARIGPSRAGTFIYLIPVFGAILAFAFLGEGLELYQLGSAAVIFLGIAAMNWKRATA